MMIRTALLALAAALFANQGSLLANINDTQLSLSKALEPNALLLADTRSKDRRENRQDDRGRQDDREERRECRDEEGAVGKDKRDCKQDERQGKNDKEMTEEKDGKDEQ